MYILLLPNLQKSKHKRDVHFLQGYQSAVQMNFELDANENGKY